MCKLGWLHWAKTICLVGSKLLKLLSRDFDSVSRRGKAVVQYMQIVSIQACICQTPTITV